MLTFRSSLSLVDHRHVQMGSLPPQAPAPPVGYVSSTMVSDLETDLADEDDEEDDDDDEEDEGYGARHPRGMEHTPGSSMDNLDSSLTGELTFRSSEKLRLRKSRLPVSCALICGTFAQFVMFTG